jgi:hypothetical protein
LHEAVFADSHDREICLARWSEGFWRNDGVVVWLAPSNR